MNFFWSSTQKDLNRRRRDPLSIALWIGIPLVIGLLIILAFGRRPQPQAHLLVADQDNRLSHTAREVSRGKKTSQSQSYPG